MQSMVMMIATCAVAAMAAPASPNEEGRWNPKKYDSGHNGKYIPTDEGKYVHIPNPYIHIDNPYDGGYGPYSHQDDPYKWEETRDQYQYVLKPPSEDNPFFKEGYYKNNGIKIIKQKHNYQENKYDYLYETENKIRQEEKAVLKNPNTIDEGIASSGFYEYIGPDGYKYRTEYTADENGFRPKMTRLETPYSGKWVVEKVNNN